MTKHKVKETWTGSQDDDQLWHFGKRFDDFQSYLASAATEKWGPNLILVSSLTSYWHVSIEKLLIRLCSHLGKERRKGNSGLSIWGITRNSSLRMLKGRSMWT